MKITCLNKCVYTMANYAYRHDTQEDPIAKERRKKICDWETLKESNTSDKDIAKVTGMSRSNYYKLKKAFKRHGLSGLKKQSTRPKNFRQSKISRDITNKILSIRLDSPSYGKSKIAIILKRDFNIQLSESSVGRVLSNLIVRNKITKSFSFHKRKRKRSFNKHAKRWEYGMKAKLPGRLIQIDHMTVTKNDKCIKEFRAWDPIAKYIVSDVTSNATSSAASKFLSKVIKEMPFPIKSIQVDGGSEFMGDFEDKCKELSIDLFVLPPSRPQYNGGVERANRTFREEFWSRDDIDADTIGEFRIALQKAVFKYNNYRPHHSLDGLTPMEYVRVVFGGKDLSQMY